MTIALHLFSLTSRVGRALALGSNDAAVLMYHGVPRKAAVAGFMDARAFEQHMRFLKENFTVLRPNETGEAQVRSGRPRVVLTFDDGFRNNAEIAAPILKKFELPAIFFVASRHIEPGRYLWFSYLEALQQFFPGDGFTFRGESMPMSLAERENTMAKLRNLLLAMKPHPEAMYEAIENELPRLEDFIPADQLQDHYAGMTLEQVRQLGRDHLFTIGVHTADHPYLTLTTAEEAASQIARNRKLLETAIDKECTGIAYPLGDYDATILQLCRDLGVKHGYAVRPRLRQDEQLEIPRIGIYSASLKVLAVKATWGRTLGVERWPRPTFLRSDSHIAPQS